MKLTKRNLINYLIDVLGCNEEEAKKITNIYGTSYLTKKQLNECIKYAS